jgi:ABC-type Fe3+ transport system substrate-binding protein
MKGWFIRTTPLFFLFVLFTCLIGADIFAASLDPALPKARQEAEAAGYTFLTSHDEIVAAAKKEGKLRVLGSFEADTYKALINAFRKHYPFIDVQVVEMTGTADPQRFFLELKAGGAKEWDVFNISPDFWSAGIPYTKKFDFLGMATHKVLAIPPAMIDPKHRTIVSMGSSIHAIAYNRKLISDDKVPNGWEEFLRPDLKGKKFLVDIRPQGFAALAAGLGEKWALDYAEKIAAQEPVWVRGQTGPLATIVSGEHTMFHLAYYHSCMRAAKKDASGSMQCKVVEPVPGRLQEFGAISHTAPHLNASLLWMEFQATPEGQKVIGNYEPFNTSIYSPESALAKVIQGKKLSMNNWNTLHNTDKFLQQVFKAFGLPRAD